MMNLSRRDLVTLGVVALLMIALGFAIGTAVTPTAQLPQNCTAGQILRWDGSAWTCTGTVVVDNTGNVGIGTTEPGTKLDVQGDTNLGGALDVKGAATLQDALTVDGNVDIGTNTPGVELGVHGMISTTEGFKFQDGTVQNTAVRIEAGSVLFDQWQGGPPERVGNVRFDSAFSEEPTVVVSLARIDADKGRNLRILVGATNVTKEGFTVHAEYWSDTKLYSAQVSWIAFGW